MNVRGNDLDPQWSHQERPHSARGVALGSNRPSVSRAEQQSSLFKNFAVPPPMRHITSNMTVTATPNQFLAENFWRRYLNIFNIGSSLIWVSFNIEVGSDGTNGIPIYPNFSYELELGTVSSVSFVCPSSTCNVRVIEGLIQKDV